MARVENPVVPRGSETVLLVDSEPQSRRLASFMLEKQGYRVLEAHDGFEALKIFPGQDGRVDLLVTEIRMPRMNGQELARRLRALQPDLRVLLMTDPELSKLAASVQQERDFRLLPKPFTMRSLAGGVRTVLDEPRVMGAW